MRVESPTALADRPPWASAALVAALALLLGLAVARWTVGAAPPIADTSHEGWLAAGENEPEGESEIELEGEREIELEGEGEGELELEPAIEPELEGEGESEIELEPAIEPEVPAASVPSIPRGPARGVLVRGRVAYLRCEGGESGGDCTRDRAIEDAIWATIETLPTCAEGPGAPGQADLVVTLADDAAPELRARDTFAAEVVRLDATATVACLADPIAADPLLTASSRRMVLSFRFSMTP